MKKIPPPSNESVLAQVFLVPDPVEDSSPFTAWFMLPDVLLEVMDDFVELGYKLPPIQLATDLWLIDSRSAP